jgi:hypothetical protein
MKQRLSILLIVLSLLLSLAVAVLSIRSTQRQDCITFLNASGSGVFVATGPNVISFGYVQNMSKVDDVPWKQGITFTTAMWGAKRSLVWPVPDPAPTNDVPSEVVQPSAPPDLQNAIQIGLGPPRYSVGHLELHPQTIIYTQASFNQWRPPAHSRFGFGWDMHMPQLQFLESPFSVLDCRSKLFVFPFWFLAILLVVAPAWSLFQLVHHRRLLANGRCSSCGYDLRATPNRCPECGTVQTKPT